jgi:hypothetical protein
MSAFFNERVESFCSEFHADKPMRLDLDSKFRQLRPELEKLYRMAGQTNDSDKALTILGEQMAGLSLLTAGCPEGERHRLLADLIHMQLNRTFTAEQRKQELVVCFCLYKQLRSLDAREE